MLEVTDAVVSVWGAGRVGMHLAPRADAHDMGDSDLPATFGYVARELGKRKHRLPLRAREGHGAAPRPGAQGGVRRRLCRERGISTRRRPRRRSPRARRTRSPSASSFLANPDLPRRFALGRRSTRGTADTFYGDGPVGYTDYPALERSGGGRIAAAIATASRLQMFDLDEGEVIRVGVDHIVLDAFAARIRHMHL